LLTCNILLQKLIGKAEVEKANRPQGKVHGISSVHECIQNYNFTLKLVYGQSKFVRL